MNTNDERWVASWSCARFGNSLVAAYGDEGFHDETVRLVLPLTVGGKRLRLRLSNLCGQRQVVFDTVTVAVSDGGSAVVPGSLTRATFGGSQRAIMEPGAEALSDPIDIDIADLDRIAISLYASAATGPPTRSEWFMPRPPGMDLAPRGSEAFVSPGDLAGQDDDPTFAPVQFDGFVAAVDVVDPTAGGVIAVLGDSTTVGYPQLLAARALRHERRLAVVNAGIEGNRLLTSSPCWGASGLVRFPNDVLLATGVRTVVGMWVNDYGMSEFQLPETGESAAQMFPLACFGETAIDADAMIGGWRQLAARAHAAGIRVIGGTTPPFKGSFYWTERKEAVRQSVNDWIRSGGELDGVADFDEALRDPDDPDQFAAHLDVGDSLHPNTAGSQAMADCIDLASC